MRLPLVLSISNLRNRFPAQPEDLISLARIGSSWIPKRAACESPLHRCPASLRRSHVQPACRLCHRRPKPEEFHSSLAVLPVGIVPPRRLFSGNWEIPACNGPENAASGSNRRRHSCLHPQPSTPSARTALPIHSAWGTRRFKVRTRLLKTSQAEASRGIAPTISDNPACR